MLFIFVIIKQTNTIEQTLTRHVINIVWAYFAIFDLNFFSSHVIASYVIVTLDMSHVIMPKK